MRKRSRVAVGLRQRGARAPGRNENRRVVERPPHRVAAVTAPPEQVDADPGGIDRRGPQFDLRRAGVFRAGLRRAAAEGARDRAARQRPPRDGAVGLERRPRHLLEALEVQPRAIRWTGEIDPPRPRHKPRRTQERVGEQHRRGRHPRYPVDAPVRGRARPLAERAVERHRHAAAYIVADELFEIPVEIVVVAAERRNRLHVPHEPDARKPPPQIDACENVERLARIPHRLGDVPRVEGVPHRFAAAIKRHGGRAALRRPETVGLRVYRGQAVVDQIALDPRSAGPRPRLLARLGAGGRERDGQQRQRRRRRAPPGARTRVRMSHGRLPPPSPRASAPAARSAPAAV